MAGLPAPRAAGQLGPAKHGPWAASVATSRCAALAGGGFLAGHAQQDLQLLGAATGGHGLLGRFQPARHDHGQGRGGRILGSAASRRRTASARTNAGPPSRTDST